MRKSGGLSLLLLAGVSAAAALYAKPGEFAHLLSRIGSLSSADAQQLGQGSLPALDVAQRSAQFAQAQQTRVFSPSTPLIEASETQATVATRMAQAQLRPSDTPARTNGFVTPLSSEGSRRLASSKPGDDDARRELTRDLQKELKRVGCFDGEVNGTWSPASKKAMSSFMDRVNATLPVEEPDYILLTLVQGHASQACGKTCPSGQGMSTDGRCQPRAILAQSARKSDDRKLVDRVEKPKAAETKIVAEAKPADVKAAEPSAIQTGSLTKPAVSGVSSWSTATVAAVEPPKPVPSAPLAGRMAMGAPVPPPEETAKLDDIEARKRRAQAALADEQKAQARAQADAERLRADRLAAEETQRREQKLKAEALAEAERLKSERQKAVVLNAEADKRDRQVAALDARRTAQREAEALEAASEAPPVAVVGATSPAQADAAKSAALAAAAIATREANGRRAVARRVREREEQRAAEQRVAEQRAAERERRAASAPAPSVARRTEPRYVQTFTAPRAAPSPTPRPSPEQRWTRTIFSDISRSR
jgi:hypothetical protein